MGGENVTHPGEKQQQLLFTDSCLKFIRQSVIVCCNIRKYILSKYYYHNMGVSMSISPRVLQEASASQVAALVRNIGKVLTW